MKITISNELTITDIENDNLYEKILEALTLDNPQFLNAEKMDRKTDDIDPYIECYSIDGDSLSIPRGFGQHLVDISYQFGEQFEFDDKRRTLPEIDFNFNGSLREYQQNAVKAMMGKDWGTLQAPTGSGKTVMAAALIAERKQPALVICHTKELLNQWIDRMNVFLDIPKDEIGIIGNGKRKIGNQITIALVQSLYKIPASEISPYIGFLIVDECHRCPSRTFLEAVTKFDCKYMLGLSATPWRKDNLTKMIYWFLGDRLHQIDSGCLVDDGFLCRADVISRSTDYSTRIDATQYYATMLSELAENVFRNDQIARDAAYEANNGDGLSLILSDRKTHCEALRDILGGYGIFAEVLTGDLPAKKRADLVDRLRAGKVKVLCATGQLIGEGFDLPAIENVFLATPIKFSGRLLQYVGRALRPAPGKDRAYIFDYVDSKVGVLDAAAKSRQYVYERTHGINYHRIDT